MDKQSFEKLQQRLLNFIGKMDYDQTDLTRTKRNEKILEGLLKYVMLKQKATASNQKTSIINHSSEKTFLLSGQIIDIERALEVLNGKEKSSILNNRKNGTHTTIDFKKLSELNEKQNKINLAIVECCKILGKVLE